MMVVVVVAAVVVVVVVVVVAVMRPRSHSGVAAERRASANVTVPEQRR
jgi:hypothetical protein